MSIVKVATCVPKQYWLQEQKLLWLDQAIAKNPCSIFLLSQEYWGGGSCREICRLKGVTTDDVPVTEEWLAANVGPIAKKHSVHIGVGATVNRDGINTEDYLFYDSDGLLVGYRSKMALPVQDTILKNGASQVLPETDFDRASSVIELPKLGIRAGVVFCWQVYFNEFWAALSAQKCSLVAHPIKYAPRAWYKKGFNPQGQPARVGFTQESGSDQPESDALGWIRKLKYESEFKELPIAVTCNAWDGGPKFLAMCGFVDEVTKHTELHHPPSVPETDLVTVHEYDPSLYDELDHLSLAVYSRFKGDWQALMQGTMRRKAVRIEQRALNGKTAEAVQEHLDSLDQDSFFKD